MTAARRLMVVAAHPDDETLGFGGVLARYASEGVETFLVTATRGQRGRYLAHRSGEPEHPGGDGARADPRARTPRGRRGARDRATSRVLDYEDQQLDRAGVDETVTAHRRRRFARPPARRLTFAPDGAYGHPDHIAISQLATTAAIVEAASAAAGSAAHARLEALLPRLGRAAVGRVSARVQEARVDGRRRRAPGDAVARLGDHDGRRHATVGPTVWRAVSCHASQVRAYVGAEDARPAAARGALGLAIVLSRVQPRQRRPPARDGSFRGVPCRNRVDDASPRDCAARDGRRDVQGARTRARRSDRRAARRRAGRPGDARHHAGGGARGAGSARAAARARHRSGGAAAARPRAGCSSTRCSTRIRASSATSPRRRRRSASSATSSPRRSTPTSDRGRSRRRRPRSKRRRCAGSRELDRLPCRATGCSSAAATWRTSSA